MALVAAAGFSRLGYQRSHAISSLRLQLPAGWHGGAAPDPFQADLRALDARTGMELKTTLVSPDSHTVAAVFVRPLLVPGGSEVVGVTQALADSMQLTACKPVAMSPDNSFANCITPSLAEQPATALIVPARLDRYFMIQIRTAAGSGQQALVLLRGLVARLQVEN